MYQTKKVHYGVKVGYRNNNNEKEKSEVETSLFATIHPAKFGKQDPHQRALTEFFDYENEDNRKYQEVDIDYVRILDMLNHPNVDEILRQLADLVSNKFDKQTKYPILARIKTWLMFSASNIGNFNKFYRMLQAHRLQWADELGYDNFDIPGNSTLREFNRDYLSPTIEENKSDIVANCLGILENYGIRPGWRGIVDSTPYEATPSDKNASYSGHYKMRGYKEHRYLCGDTDIPLGWKITPNTDFDGHHLSDLLDQASEAGVGMVELWMDGHYATFTNLADLSLNYDLKSHFKIHESWVIDHSVDEERINNAYQYLHSHEDFLPADDPECTLQFKLKFIFNNSWFDSHPKLVGKYIRNQHHLEEKETPKQYLGKQGFRSRIEGGFGVEKRYSSLKLAEIRGLKSWEAYLGLRNLLDLVLSVFWVDMGRRTNLTSSKELVI